MHESVHSEGKFHNKKFASGILRGLAVHCVGTGPGGLESLSSLRGVIIDGSKGESQAKQGGPKQITTRNPAQQNRKC
jgi:hypothetical protein